MPNDSTDPQRHGEAISDEQFLQEHANGLPRSTVNAKWIHSPDEGEDYAGQTLATRSHAVIQHWAEERKATPVTVPGTEHDAPAGTLRFSFPGYGSDKLQEISWDEFFKTFDERDLVFLFQQRMTAGNQSNFCHFERPDE